LNLSWRGEFYGFSKRPSLPLAAGFRFRFAVAAELQGRFEKRKKRLARLLIFELL
jgi:hypothetical protein